jgi:serine protease Do
MMHRFLLCIVFLSLLASAQPDEQTSGANGEGWSFGFGSDEGGSGSSYLGVDIADVTSERLSALKLKEEHGAEITMVDADAPAGKAGLREHDVILSLNGTAVESAAQLRRMIKEIPPGRVVTLGLSRDGRPQEIKVQLADRRKAMAWEPGNHEFKFEMPEMPKIPDIDLPISVVIAHSSLRSGLMVESITPQLGEFFGVKGGNGVLVRSVEKGSRGEKAGFRAGDVIVKVNNQPVRDPSDFTHALRSSSGSSAAVTVMRDKREQNLTLALPEKKDSGLLLDEDFAIPDVMSEADRAVSLANKEVARLDMKKLEREMLRAGELQKKAEECVKQQQQQIEKRLEEQLQKLREQQQKMLDRQQKGQRHLSGQWAEI